MHVAQRRGATRSAMWARCAVTSLLVVYGLLGAVLIAHQVTRVPELTDVGYADSYVYRDAQGFRETGRVYRDLAQEPSLPTIYSPAIYMLYSLPGRILATGNFFVGPRLVALAAFLGCLVLVGSITRVLVPGRYAWIWGILLACTVWSLWDWVLMLRADFPGILLNLVAIRLLLTGSRRLVPVAGLCAGLALQFKLTCIAAGFAGTIWLASRREWKLAAQFVIVAALTSAGLYALYALREPQMLPQMFGMSPGLPDLRGAFKLTYVAMGNILLPLALGGLPLLSLRPPSKWILLLLYVATAAGVGALTIVQAGASDNYYFEALFGVVPLALLGVYHLQSLMGRNPRLAIFVSAMLAVYVVLPLVMIVRDRVVFAEPVAAVNQRFEKFRDVVQGKHIFSTLPRIALLDASPALLEPGLLNYLHELGKIDRGPLIQRVGGAEFDVVVVNEERTQWRTIPFVSQELHDSILSAYEPRCVYSRWLVLLPRGASAAKDFTARRLSEIGCTPYGAKGPLDW